MAGPKRALDAEQPRPRRALDAEYPAAPRAAGEDHKEAEPTPTPVPEAAQQKGSRPGRLAVATGVLAVALVGAANRAPAIAALGLLSTAPVAITTPIPTSIASLAPAQRAGETQVKQTIKPVSRSSARPAVTVSPADPATPRAVAGIPQPCAAQHPYPAGATPAEVKAQLQRWSGIRLTGPGWAEPQNHTLVRITWETLDGLGCTDYVDDVNKAYPGFALYAGPTRSWAWGDWGLTHPGAVTLDFAKWRTVQSDDPGRLVRILVHEIGHAWSLVPANRTVYSGFSSRYAKLGNFGPYAYSSNETFSEIIGYYVARCANDNPYDATKYAPYYSYVREHVFAGREFGPAAGEAVSCG